MTLILSVIHNGLAYQVADRLTTVQLGDATCPRDHYFNKNVVFCPHNAVVSIAFTGLAALEGKPTDEWIAEVLWGQPFPRIAAAQPDGSTVLLRGGVSVVAPQPNPRNLGVAIEGLRKACEDQLSRIRRDGTRAPLEITVVGWQRTYGSDRARALLWMIKRPSQDTDRFIIERNRELRGSTASLVSASPSRPEFAHLESSLLVRQLRAAATADEVETAMTDAIRHVSLSEGERQRVVGPDSGVIRLDPSSRPQVLLSYAPAGPRVPGHESPDGAFHHMTFTPYVIAPQGFMNPSVITGESFEVDFGEVTVKVLGDATSPYPQMFPQKRDLDERQMIDYLRRPFGGMKFLDVDTGEWR